MSKRLLIGLAIVLVAVSLFLQNQNSRSARSQAAVIIAADTASQDVKPALAALKNFTSSHMGTTIGLTLGGSYARAQAAATSAAEAASSVSTQVYVDAQRACAGKTDSITQAKCNQMYLASHLANLVTPTPVPTPRSADYLYFFKAPLWTPDLAGALLGGGVIAGLWAGGLWLRRRGRR